MNTERCWIVCLRKRGFKTVLYCTTYKSVTTLLQDKNHVSQNIICLARCDAFSLISPEAFNTVSVTCTSYPCFVLFKNHLLYTCFKRHLHEKLLKLVKEDLGIMIPGSQLTGLAQLPCNHKVCTIPIAAVTYYKYHYKEVAFWTKVLITHKNICNIH